jgi:hypothetical protein
MSPGLFYWIEHGIDPLRGRGLGWDRMALCFSPRGLT